MKAGLIIENDRQHVAVIGGVVPRTLVALTRWIAARMSRGGYLVIVIHDPPPHIMRKPAQHQQGDDRGK